MPDPSGRYRAAAGAEPGAVGVRAPRVAGPLTALGLPLVATSANDPGGPEPSVVDEVPERIRRAVGLEIDGGRLPGTASAVVDLRAARDRRPARLLRPGPDPGGDRRRAGRAPARRLVPRGTRGANLIR